MKPVFSTKLLTRNFFFWITTRSLCDGFQLPSHSMTMSPSIKNPSLASIKNREKAFLAESVQQFCGEWVVWHSSNNRKEENNHYIVHLYPNQQICISHKYDKGPFVFHHERKGTFTVHKRKKDDKYQTVIRFHSYRNHLLSIYGVGVGSFFSSEYKKGDQIKTILNLYTMEPNNLYLCNDSECYHLVKSVRINEPQINVPISTFVFTQILGICFTEFIHHIFFFFFIMKEKN